MVGTGEQWPISAPFPALYTDASLPYTLARRGFERVCKGFERGFTACDVRSSLCSTFICLVLNQGNCLRKVRGVGAHAMIQPSAFLEAKGNQISSFADFESPSLNLWPIQLKTILEWLVV